MSDYDDDEFMCDNVGDEDEDYDLEYSEDSNSEPDVDLENAYYNSKALKEESPSSALESFQRVLDLEGAGEKGEWGFKALKQMIKINFRDVFMFNSPFGVSVLRKGATLACRPSILRLFNLGVTAPIGISFSKLHTG